MTATSCIDHLFVLFLMRISYLTSFILCVKLLVLFIFIISTLYKISILASHPELKQVFGCLLSSNRIYFISNLLRFYYCLYIKFIISSHYIIIFELMWYNCQGVLKIANNNTFAYIL